MTAEEITHVYEVVDGTDDEQYFALGIFLNEADALAVLDHVEPPSNDNDHDSVTIEVRRRKVGFHPHEHEVLASRTWVTDYEDAGSRWIANPIKFSALSVKGRGSE